MYKCGECDKIFNDLKGVCLHYSRSHGITSEEAYLKVMLSNVKPLCKCGCGESPTYLSADKGYRDFVRGHASRINNNWGHNGDALKKSHNTQKEMYSKGELVIWNKGLTVEDSRVKNYADKIKVNTERGGKISKALTGIPKTQEHKDNLRKSQLISWSDPLKREKQSNTRMEYIIKNGLQIKSKLESTFKDILTNELSLVEGVDFYPQFYVREIKSLFDFKISGKPIMIEVDGDYWHCNPEGKFPNAIYPSQIKNLIKDNTKNEWCLKNNIKLLRFWESDINKTPEIVIERLNKELGF